MKTVSSITLQFIIWLYKWSRVTFTELTSAVVKIPWHYHHFPWLSMTFAIFQDFPGLKNDLPKFHDFPWPGGTLGIRPAPLRWGVPKIWPAPYDGAYLTPRYKPLSIGVTTTIWSFQVNWSLCIYKYLQKFDPLHPAFKVTQGHWNRHWSIGHLRLLTSVP